MKITTRQKQIGKMLLDSLRSLFQHQTELNFDTFSISVMEALMLLEREHYLKSQVGAKDYGNGAYTRTFRSLRKNSLQISIPRSRNGAFKPLLLEFIRSNHEQVQELAILLYRKGLSTRDVSSVMAEFFGESMSRETVNNLAESFHEIRMEWEKTPLEKHYKVIYCDALFVNLKRANSYSKEALYLIYGVKDDNTRELLLLEVNPTESSKVWGEYLNKLKERGLEQVDLIVADGLLHFADEAKKVYPCANTQRCVVHLTRNLLNKVRPKEKEAFSVDLKHVFDNFSENSSRSEAQKKLETFVAKWETTYPRLMDRLRDMEYVNDYFTYIDYPVDVRRMLYTTNAIENLNRQIRRVLKTKVTFDKEANLLDLAFMIVKDFESRNWMKYPVTSFGSWNSFTHFH